MRPPEIVKMELVEDWIKKAEKDYRLIEHLIVQEEPFFDQIGFHAQQAVEKYLKAYLTHKQVDFPKTHDLKKLLDLVATVNEGLAKNLDDVQEVTEYGVEIRYPGDFPDMNKDDAIRAVELARMAREKIMNLLDLDKDLK